jgi:hypothetical protein
MASTGSKARETTQVTVVGGGIAGLYAAYLLAREPGYSVEVLDLTRERLGGKITTREITVDGVEFRAEFGPMRFELDLQTRFRRLCQHLGIGFTPFPATGSPKILTEYEMTDIESSFDSVAELHEWAVLKMFFGSETGKGSDRLPGSQDVGVALQHIEKAHTDDGTRPLIGLEQLRWLQCYLDDRLFIRLERDQWVPVPCEEMERNLDRLRFDHPLQGEIGWPLLRNIGLWHALSEVITPGALAKIRDSGTFYHCILNNPSAVEWGIFWLRQASALGNLWTFDEQAKEGVWTLVQELEKRLRRVHRETGRGSIQRGREVVQIEPAKRPTEIVLRVVENDRSGEQRDPYSLRTDHVILALPQLPLRRLNEHFPGEVNQRIEGVEALQLLKAFVVTKNPWWQPHLKAQSYAWLVPTRELHFYRGEKQTCPSLKDVGVGERRARCDCGVANDGPGMIMLYTDQPGIHYWDLLIPPEKRKLVLWHHLGGRPRLDPQREVVDQPFELLDLLVRRLLVVPHPGLAYTINNQKERFFEQARVVASEPGLSESSVSWLARLPDQLESQPGKGDLLGFAQSIVELLGRDTGRQVLIRQILEGTIDALPEKWLDYLTTALKIREGGISVADVEEAAKDVVAYGIRDWSAEPFGGAAHLWKPGFSATPVKNGRPIDDPLLGFSLRERVGGPRNVHICGEAFSGNQGFIEGALQTAERVVGQILGTTRLKHVITENLGPFDETSASDFEDDHRAKLAEAWRERFSLITKMP